MMNNEELIQAIRQWGIDRKIIGNGTFEGQWLKLISEIGELADSLAKGKSPIDDIGDCFVVLVMMEGIDGTETLLTSIRFAEKNSTWANGGAISCLRDMLICSGDLDRWSDEIHKVAFDLSFIAKDYNLTVNECLSHAYNEIKDRKGYLNENGVFIKDEPLDELMGNPVEQIEGMIGNLRPKK